MVLFKFSNNKLKAIKDPGISSKTFGKHLTGKMHKETPYPKKLKNQ